MDILRIGFGGFWNIFTGNHDFHHQIGLGVSCNMNTLNTFKPQDGTYGSWILVKELLRILLWVQLSNGGWPQLTGLAMGDMKTKCRI
jgi:hypothetical protein